MSDNLTLALQLAARGWAIFPCKPDKTPFTTHGFKDATQDPDKIRAFWERWPGALLGIACERSGIFALDLDHKNGLDGMRDLAELVETFGLGADIPTGPIQKTPSGGYHVLFNLPPDLKIPNNAGKLAPGIDLRSAGYICSGGAYEWQPEHGPQAALTDAPAWLLDLIRNLSERRPAPQVEQPEPVAMGNGAGDPGAYWLQYYLARCSPGNRNEHGFYLACQLRDSGLSEGEAAGLMASYAARVPGEGYTEREALASLQSAYHGPKREAAHLPGLTTRRNGHGPTNDINPHLYNQSEPPAAFEDWPSEPEPGQASPNLDTFSDMQPLPESAQLNPDLGAGAGKWIDLYTEYSKGISPMTPAIFHESAALWLASVAIARRMVLNMPWGSVYPNLFILWLAPTTLYRKSTGLNVAREIARTVFAHLLAPQDTTPEAFLSDLAGQQPANYATMTTAEQEAWTKERNFAAQRGWILDELSGLMAGAGKDYNAGLLEALLRFYDCDPIYTRSTRSQGRVIVKNSYLSLLGASTPAAMSSHLTVDRLWGNGFWPRFAILTPDNDRPDWIEARETDQSPELTGALINLQKHLPSPMWPDPIDPISVHLGEGVFDTWKRYNRALSYDLLTPDLNGQLWGAYGRIPTHALKVAMILAALDWKEGQACRIELSHLARSMAICESWRASIHRAMTGALSTNYDQLRRRILRQIAKVQGGATFREIYRGMQDKTPGEIEMTLSEMMLAGEIEKLAPEPGRRGRPAERYVLVVS